MPASRNALPMALRDWREVSSVILRTVAVRKPQKEKVSCPVRKASGRGTSKREQELSVSLMNPSSASPPADLPTSSRATLSMVALFASTGYEPSGSRGRIRRSSSRTPVPRRRSEPRFRIDERIGRGVVRYVHPKPTD